MKKDKIKEIEITIARLLREIEQLRDKPECKIEFRGKLKQLMYWRRRRNQMGANHVSRNKDINQIEEEVRDVSALREGYYWDNRDIEFEEDSP